MVEWNEIFLLFRFSGILGQPREVLPKFRNEIPENVFSLPNPGFPEFLVEWKAPYDVVNNFVLNIRWKKSDEGVEHLICVSFFPLIFFSECTICMIFLDKLMSLSVSL